MLARRSSTHRYTAVHSGELVAAQPGPKAAVPGWVALQALAEHRVLHAEHMCLGVDAVSQPTTTPGTSLAAPPSLTLAASNVTPATVRQRLLVVAAPLSAVAEPAADHMWVGGPGGTALAAARSNMSDFSPPVPLPSPQRSTSTGSTGVPASAHFMPSAAWVKQLSRASSVEPVGPALQPPAMESAVSASSAGTSSFGVSDANAVLHWRRRALLVGVLPPLVRQFIERYGLYGLRFASSGIESGVRVGWLAPPLTELYSRIAGMAAEQRWSDVASLGGSTSADCPARSKHVAVLGGSFHPITAAHLSVAADVAADESVSEVWIVPCGARPDKPSLTTAAHERLLQCVLAAEHAFPSDLPVYVMPLEVAQGAAVPSYVLLSALTARFQDTRFSLVIGMDLVPTLPGWTFSAGLLANMSFLVVPRPGYDLSPPPTNSTTGGHNNAQERFQTLCLADGLPTVEVHLSSSEVRLRVKEMVGPMASALQGASAEAHGTLYSALEAAPARSRSRSGVSDAFAGVRSALCGLVPPYVNSRLLDAEPGAHPRKQLLALTSDPAVP